MLDIATERSAATLADGQPAGAARASLVRHYFEILMRRKWFLVAPVVATTMLGIILTLLATPRYTATAQLEIRREASRIVKVEGVEPDTSSVDMEFYQTQYGLLASRSLAEAVMKSLRLADDEQFLDLMGVNEAIESKGIENDRNAVEDEVVKALLRNVSISPIRLSSLVNVSFASPDPAMSAKIANSWAEMFIQSNLARRFESTAYARKFLEGRLEELRQRLEDTERQAVGYASNEAIINLPGNEATSGDASRDRSLISDTLASLNTELAAATADRIAAEARLGGARGAASKEALENIALSNMRQQLAEARADYARVLSEFTPDYPGARVLKARIDALQASISREEGRIQSTLVNQYRDAQAREAKLQGQVDALKASFNDQRRRAIQYNIYQREVDTNRQLYEALLQRYKEIGVASGVGSNNISIVDRAVAPDKPSSPRPLLNLVLAIFAGLVAGVLLVLLREQLDEGIADPAEVERRLGLPLLGVVPRIEEGEQPIADVRDPKSGLAEAYLSIDTQLGFTTPDGVPKTLAITSTRPAEGKSTTAFAIAHWLARSGARVLFVDADMRSPSIHEFLGVDNATGLSNILSGSQAMDEVLRKSDADRFDFITAGRQPPNAAELLRGKNLSAFLDQAQSRYDNVVIDSPPVMGLADALLLGGSVDATVFVVEAQGVRTRLVQNALERLRSSRVNLVGIILSKFDAQRAKTGYDYGYGYGYGTKYGEDAGA